MGMFLAVVTACFFSMGNLFIRHGTDHLHRDAGFLLATTTNALVLCILAAGTLAARGLALASLPALLLFAAGGVFGTFCGRWTSIRSIERLGPSRGSTFKNTQPLFTAAIAVPLLGEPFAPASLFGAVLVMLGVWFLTTERPGQHLLRWEVRPEDRRLGVVLGLVSAVAYSSGNVLRKMGIGLWPEPAIGAGVAIVGTMVPTLMSPAIWRQRATLRRPWHRGHLLFIGWGLCTSVAQLAFFSAIDLSPVWMVNVVMAVEPLLTILLSFILYRGRERLGRRVLLSAALVTAGIAVLAG